MFEPRADQSAHRVTLYTRPGCHLCEAAQQVVERVVGAAYQAVDIDDEAADPALALRYGEEVPVVCVDGRQIGYWRIEQSALRAALAARAPRPA